MEITGKIIGGCLVLLMVYGLLFATYFTPLIVLYFFLSELSGLILNALFFGFAFYYTFKYPIEIRGIKFPIILPVFMMLWFAVAAGHRLLAELPYIDSKTALSELKPKLKNSDTLILQTERMHQFYNVSLTENHFDEVVKVSERNNEQTIISTKYLVGDQCFQYPHKQRRDFLSNNRFSECLPEKILKDIPNGVFVKLERSFFHGIGCCNKLIVSNYENGNNNTLLTLETGSKQFLSLFPSFPIGLPGGETPSLWEVGRAPVHSAFYGASVLNENQIVAALYDFTPRRFLKSHELTKTELSDVISKAHKMSQSDEKVIVQNSVANAYLAADRLQRKHKSFDRKVVETLVANIGHGSIRDIYLHRHTKANPGTFFKRLNDADREYALDLIYKRATTPNICNQCKWLGSYLYSRGLPNSDPSPSIGVVTGKRRDEFLDAFFQYDNLDFWQYQTLIYLISEKRFGDTSTGMSQEFRNQRDELFVKTMLDKSEAFALRFRALQSHYGRLSIDELLSLSGRLDDISDMNLSPILDDIWLRYTKDERTNLIKNRVKMRLLSISDKDVLESIEDWLERK